MAALTVLSIWGHRSVVIVLLLILIPTIAFVSWTKSKSNTENDEMTTLSLSTFRVQTSTTTMPPQEICDGNVNWIGDEVCDDSNNNIGCEYDGGDCCLPDQKKCIACICYLDGARHDYETSTLSSIQSSNFLNSTFRLSKTNQFQLT